ncbi:DUF1269 domain-containing protein [Nonomuraea sp. MTCD27]|uniref:DUF1269 domain-containing protein n=1 Tax=Nonomuraea sp. MTCD27 TaxID=1676747 RepID=UPI0035C06BF8
MSHLIAIAYPDVRTAMSVRDRLAQMQKENLITLEDAAVVEREQAGKIKLHQSTSMVGMGAAGGALSDAGVDDDFMRQLATKLEPGTAALFLLVVQSTPDKVIPQIAEYGGHIIQTTLSHEEEEQLRATAQAATRTRTS